VRRLRADRSCERGTDFAAAGAPGTPLVEGNWIGYTLGMKTAVSVPEEVFEEGERLARRLQISRSELYSRAVHEYVCRHAPDHVTEALDRLVDELGPASDEFVQVAGRRSLERSEWE
jgi:metal-responsive CopG/Arc/MetJ family transcriptional regulator